MPSGQSVRQSSSTGRRSGRLVAEGAPGYNQPARREMSELPKRQLGRTGLQVSMLGYGAMELRGAPRGRDVTDQQAETILNAVLDSGINYIDTSIDYGVSEERIGRYIGDRRAEYYLASKCGCVVGAPAAPRGQSSPHIFTRDNIMAGARPSPPPLASHYPAARPRHTSPPPT